MNIRKLTAAVMPAAAALFLLISVPAQGAKEYTWVPAKQVSYTYSDGKWVKENESTETYDKKSRLVSTKFTAYSPYQDSETKKTKILTVTEETKYSYGKNGQISLIKSYRDGTLNLTTRYTHNKSGSPVKLKMTDAAGKTVQTITYTYGTSGKTAGLLIKTVRKTASGNTNTSTFKYTVKNSTVRKIMETGTYGTATTVYTAKGILSSYTYQTTDNYTYVCRYDSSGEPLTVDTADYDGSVTKTVYTRKNGRLTKETETKTVIEDGKAKTVKRIYTYKYKTDKNGNVTQRIQYLNGKRNSKIIYSGYQKIRS